MALQFLVDPDRNLGEPPIEALRAGEEAPMIQAARARASVIEASFDYPIAPPRLLRSRNGKIDQLAGA